MFVSESTLNFMGTKLQMISTEGFSWDAAFDPSATIESIKKLAIQYFYPNDISISSEQFRVIYPAESRALSDHHALHEEHVKDNEILLFVRRRSAANAVSASNRVGNPLVRTNLDNTHSNQAESEMKTPTAADILAATKDLEVPLKNNLPASPSPKTGGLHQHQTLFGVHDDSDSNVDFQLELRKIIISLVSVMATLLQGNKDADLICAEMQSRIKTRLKNSSSKPIEGSTYQFPPAPEVESTPMGIVQGLTEAKKREFRPNPKALTSLREMGFTDEQIILALRANKNSKDAACEWLLSGKDSSPIEADDIHGLDRNSHLFTALVSAPTVRLGLINPKTLLAFLNILESPASANTWLNDNDTAPVLSAIFKIYHAEKHAAPAETS